MIKSPDQQPLFEPPSNWQPYVGQLPKLHGLEVAIDTETRDAGLESDRGPGWFNNNGWLCGVSVAYKMYGSIQKFYLPVRHPNTECWDLSTVIAWIDDVMSDNTIIFHNAGYDMGWFRASGSKVWPRRMHDTFVQAVMIEENHRAYNLDECCRRAGVKGKNEAALINAANAYGVDPKSGLWRLPAKHVGIYAEDDAEATLELHHKQYPIMLEQKVDGAYQTEIDLIPCLYDMKKRGIKVNMETAERVRGELRIRREAAIEAVGRIAGRKISMLDINSGDRLGPVFDALDIKYARTAKAGKPQINKLFLEKLSHPIGGHIRNARKLNDMAEKFVGTYIMEHAHIGRIHSDIHQLRDEDGGTRTHRLSYSDPPMQQAPARDEEMGPLFRSMFEPEDGELWCAPDYASQEPRLTVHYASLTNQPGAEDMVRYFTDDPKADLHQWNANLIGWTRKKSKDVYQAMAYGAQERKLADMLGLSVEDAAPILATFNKTLPWIGGMSEYAGRMGAERGYIRLIDGARLHFPMWEPQRFKSLIFRTKRNISEERTGPLTYKQMVSPPLFLEEAQQMWPEFTLVRAHTYKAMNKLMQGSGARQTKRAMVACHQAGIPLLIQMHDEISASVGDSKIGLQIAEIMRDVVKLVIPVRVDLEYGKTWGNAKHTWEGALNA